MEQTTIYDFIGQNHDSLFQELATLCEGEHFVVSQLTVSLNLAGLFEISTPTEHMAFSGILDCYRFLSQEIGVIELTG